MRNFGFFLIKSANDISNYKSHEKRAKKAKYKEEKNRHPQPYRTDRSYILKNNEKENPHSRHVQRQRGVRWPHEIRKGARTFEPGAQHALYIM